MSVREQIADLQKELPEGVNLVAVSKMHPASDIEEAYVAGQRVFGESRPQELCAKYEALPKDIEWHMIGHLQTNKVRSIVPFVSMIQSVDSAHLLAYIDKEAARIDRVVDVLLEIFVAQEETKHGWEEEELLTYLREGSWRSFEHVRFRGVMGIASLTENQMQIRSEFVRLRSLFDRLRGEFFGVDFDTVSMGMTSDWKLAVECGSNMVRIGSLIFGARNYGASSLPDMK